MRKSFQRTLFIAALSLMSLPTLAKADLEDDGTAEGIVNENVLDYIDGSSKTEFTLEATDKLGKKNGKIYKIYFPNKKPKDLHTGKRVKVKGKLKKGSSSEAEVESVEANVAGGSSSGSISGSGSLAQAGVSNVLVLRVAGANGAPDCSTGGLASTMQHINGLYNEASYGKFGFSSAEVMDVSVSGNFSGCDYTNVQAQADAKVGARVNSFRHVVYIFNGSCGWAGLGNISGTRTWIPSSYCGFSDVIAHELGHNLGMHHAGTDRNNDKSVDCEYCGTEDTMGYGGIGDRHFNGAHTVQMGWGNAVEVGAAGGTYNLGALETNSSNATLRFSPSSGSPYYISFRAPLGTFSSGLPEGDRNRTEIIRYAGGSTVTLKIATLGNGETFTDSQAGFTITQLSSNSTGATVQINNRTSGGGGGGTCITNPPSIGLSPSLASTNNSGATLSYVVSVRNNDGAYCTNPTNFNFSSQVPSGWGAPVFQSGSMQLAPGSSGQTSFTVTSPSGIASGDYSFAIMAGGSSGTSQANGVYRLNQTVTPPTPPSGGGSSGGGSDTAPPTMPKSLSSKKKRVGKTTAYTIDLKWVASKDNVGVTSYLVRRKNPDGSVVDVATVGGLTAQDLLGVSNSKGKYTYWVIAYDAAGNQSPQSKSRVVSK